MLVLDHISKRYGSVMALDDINLHLPDDGYVVIAGESGSGKTTLLQAIAGHIAIDAGQILLGGRDITPLPPFQRPVSTVFQQYALFPHMTVAKNIAFGLEQQSVSPQQIAARVAAMLDLVGLVDLGSRKPTTLSGGQQQRVALARALAVNPKAILLDEPLGALDDELRSSMRRELMRIQRESEVLFVHVSHDRDEALTLAETLLVLHQGRVIGFGSPDNLRGAPGNTRVAHIVGFENVLPFTDDGGLIPVCTPESIMLGDGEWGGVIIASRILGGLRERWIQMESGNTLRQREPMHSETDAWPQGEQVRFWVDEQQMRKVKRIDIH